MKKAHTKALAQGAAIAASYVVLTFLANALGLSSGVIQLRFSEALTILPVFTPAAVPGLFAGCLLANILTGCLPLDVIFGSLATLLGALARGCCAGGPIWQRFRPSSATCSSSPGCWRSYTTWKAASYISC